MWYTNDPFYNLITFLQTNLMATGSVVMSICLLRSGKKFVHIINDFIGLFRRVQCLTPHRQVMGMHQLMFLLIIVICVGNSAFGFLLILKYTDWREVAIVTTKIYLETGLVVSLHIASIGYMCIGALYNYMNRYMREDLLPRARCLDHVLRRNKTYRPPRYTRKLIRLTRELNNCAKIYNDIYNLATTFHQNIRYQILFALLFEFSLLTTVEIFINRMNLYEFKPNVLGFFDISSDILVMFLSASITYLTYILQNTKLSQKL
ncbi:uncharacterized protein LOC120775457 [Bactrocera tryoni]|uniref:uncharacterized protein LOC120775457 n=1 Tax=Bactrocera tryoni TaxID=59916 RepID=UPI001A96449D|nr:uncharacterized protein LOC120775457 [Bactrocera tryoni]